MTKPLLDLASEMEEVLDARRLGATIRIEIEQGAPRALERTIRSLASRKSAQVFTVPGELDIARTSASRGCRALMS